MGVEGFLQAGLHFIQVARASPEELRTPHLLAAAVEGSMAEEEAALREVGAAERLMVEAVEVRLPAEAAVALRAEADRTSELLLRLDHRALATMT
jgi:hypothetical protein